MQVPPVTVAPGVSLDPDTEGVPAKLSADAVGVFKQGAADELNDRPCDSFGKLFPDGPADRAGDDYLVAAGFFRVAHRRGQSGERSRLRPAVSLAGAVRVRRGGLGRRSRTDGR